MMVTGLFLLDGALDAGRLASAAEGWVAGHPRLRGARRDFTVPIDRPRLARASDAPGLRDFVSARLSGPFDLARGPCDLALAETGPRGAAVLARVHPCLADDPTLVRILLSLCDGVPALPARVERGARPADPHPFLERWFDAERRAAWSAPVPEEFLAAVGRLLGAPPRQVLAAAFSGALRRYGNMSALRIGIPYVVGPEASVTLAGVPVRTMVLWVPQPVRLGIDVSFLSYAGEVRVAVATEADIVPDPERVIAGFDREMAGLIEQVPWKGAALLKD